jgi:hypothetical protein
MRFSWGQSPGMYAYIASDFHAGCGELQVASQASSSALRVRSIVGDREITISFLYQIHHLPPLFLHNACSVPRRNVCVDASVYRSGGLLLCLVKPVAV